VLFIAGTPKFVSQALKKKNELNWGAKTYLNSVSASIDSVLKPAGLNASKGSIVATIFKDPSDAQWANDADIKAFREVISKTNYDADDLFVLRGYSAAATMTEALRNMQAPTREALMKSIRNMKYAAPGMLPGIQIETKPGKVFPLESAILQSFNGEKWVPFGDVITVDVSGMKTGK
jgi:branched-chain amino acid transport system substrate-binding protein